ncbi:MAG: hypothetical protein R3C05_27580 [Pirellulaceae bacterium]
MRVDEIQFVMQQADDLLMQAGPLPEKWRAELESLGSRQMDRSSLEDLARSMVLRSRHLVGFTNPSRHLNRRLLTRK